ncbi:MAG TPA: alpha-L-rhamnosidase C-terminal domain-containing protein [Candidatus Sulfotelmatobacter sp.]
MLAVLGALLGMLILQVASAQPASQSENEPPREMWSAEWITSPDGPQRDVSVLHFRKVIELAQASKQFLIHVSADNQFILYVNQQRVGSGPAKSDLGHWRYESYDIAPFLHPGRNLLAATVWNFGVLTPLAQISDRTGFVLHGDNETERIADTNESWEVEEEKGARVLPTPAAVRDQYYVAEPAERIDGTAFDWKWNSDSAATDFSAANSNSPNSWKKAEAIGHATPRGAVVQENNWQLVPDPLPAMQMELTSAGRVVRTTGIDVPSGFPDKPFTVPPHAKVAVLIDQSHLTTAYPELTVSGGRGATIRLTYAEALIDANGMKGNRNETAGKHIQGIFDEFLPDGAANRSFSPLGWKTWRYLQIDVETADQPLEITKLQTFFTAYPFERRGHFESDDASLTPIWDIGWRTARLDAHDTYMDTPYYERMQYVGDTRIQALISYTVGGDDRLPRQAIQAFNNSRIPEGLTRSRYPSSMRQIIPTFSLLWVGMVHDFWMYRNDPNFVRAQLPGTRAVLDWFLDRQRPDGLLRKIPWWPFVDWGKDFEFGEPPQDADGGSSPITLQFIEALRYAAEMESSLGDKARAELYRSAAEHASQAVYKLCWNRQYGLLADTPAQKHYSQHANILGVWLDVIPPAQQENVLTKILSASDAGFTPTGPVPPMTQATYYFRFYLARAVDHVGLGNDYLRLLGPWREMVALGLTTWAETPEPTRSDSHAWSAHPNYDLLTIVAGIRPASPGFLTVMVAPHLGSLKHVSAALPSSKGMIETEYKVENSEMKAVITLPAGVSGEFVWSGKSLKLHEGEQELQQPAE